MKIVFLLSSLNAGGAERVASTLANAWVKQGHELIMVPCFSQGSGHSFYSLDERIKVHWLSNNLPRNKWLARLVKPFVLRKLMRTWQADVMVSFLTNVNVMALIAAKGLKIPLIVCERSDFRFQKISALLSYLRQKLYPDANAVMLQTESVEQAFKQQFPTVRHTAVIPNPLPEKLSKQAPVLDTPKVILAMGRLVKSKQFDDLIDCFNTIHQQCPEWELHIYGEGPEASLLHQKIVALNLTHKVFLKGKTAEPWQKMREVKILAMSSRLEGFPNVMLEAMACGLPVVCYDCPSGPRELSLDGQVAYLVTLGDKQGFAQGLFTLMQDATERERLARVAQESVYARYGQEQVLAQWDKLLFQVQQK